MYFYLYFPDGNVIIVDSGADYVYGLRYTGSGTIYVDGDSAAGIPDRHYNPKGQVIVDSGADYTYTQAAGSGVKLNGSALLDTFRYEATGGVIVDGHDLTTTSYRYRPRGNIILIGGSADCSYGTVITGSVKLNGSATINYLDYYYTASGGVLVDGHNEIVRAELHWATTGKIIIIGGEARVLPGQYRYTATGGIYVSGVSDLLFTFFDETCPDGLLRCKIFYPNAHLVCPSVLWYYGDQTIYEDYFYDVTSKGMLAVITACQQRFHLPPTDRHPKVPKQRPH